MFIYMNFSQALIINISFPKLQLQDGYLIELQCLLCHQNPPQTLMKTYWMGGIV